MKKFNSCVFSGACLALALVVAPAGAYADTSSIKVQADVRAQALWEENLDFGTQSNDPTDSQLIEARVKVSGDIAEDISFLLEGRGVKNWGAGGSVDSDTGEAAGRDDFLELRQTWIEFEDIAGYAPLSIRAGRQRIREDLGLWWNRDFDALSVAYDASLFNGKLTVGQNLAEYRTSNDTFNQDDEDIFQVLAETSWQWKYGQYLETRFAYQNDYSDMEDVGSIINSDDRDESDADLFWGGVRVQGDLGGLRPELETSRVNYRIDLMAVAGSDDVQSSTSGPGDRRTVSSVQENDVFGWAIDAELDVPLPVPTDPLLILGYAFGSGDKDPNDNDDDAFRQTELNGNTSRPGIATGSIHNYGSILRPDLSNIHIVTAGLTIPFTDATDFSTIYHYYLLDEEDASIPTSGLDANLNGTDKELGHGLDLMLNMNLTKEFGLPKDKIKRVALKTTLGAFHAGDAYGAGEDETAYRGQIELRFKF